MPQISVLTPSIRPEFLHITQECLENQTFQGFEWLTEIGLRNHGFTLPSDMNKMLRRARGERVVILQDCIKIEPDTLERIMSLPNQCYTFPVGQVTSYDSSPEWDWRVVSGLTGKITANLWENDLACAPLQAFYDVGGYDEEFNKGWSWDNVEIAWRIQATGREFFLDPTIRGIALKHDAVREHPFRTTRELNDKRAEETRRKASHGEYRLAYLTK